MNAAISAAVTTSAGIVTAGYIAADIVVTTTITSAYTAADTALSGRITAVEAKTANQTTIAGVSTTFVGEVSADSVSADSVSADSCTITTGDFDTLNSVNQNMTGTMSGLGKLNLSSTSGAHLIQAPSITLNSLGGAGGIYLGNYTDFVYINGFLFQSYLWNQWTPP
jgi:hypothetical protein